MDKGFHSLFSLIRLSPARRILIFQRMLVIATALSFTRLIERLNLALAHEVEAHKLLGKYRAQKRGNLYAVPVQPIDVKADHLLSDLRSLLIGLAMGLEADHPIKVAVGEVIKGIYPNGVGAITMLRYVEQVAAMEEMVRDLRGIYASQVALLGIEDKVELLVEVTREYRSAVNAGRRTDRAEARATDERGHEYLIEVIGLIVGGAKDTNSPEHATNRDELLAPLYEQIDIVRALRRARRGGDNDMPGDDSGYDDDLDTDIDNDIDDDIDDDIDMDGDSSEELAAATPAPAASGQ